MVLNPVPAGVVEKPESWRWSSYQSTAGLRKGPDDLTSDWILELFSSKKAVARKEYRAFVREGIHRGSPWGELQGQVLLGEEGFVEKFREVLEDKKQVKEIPRAQRYVNRPILEKIFSGQKAKAQRDISIHDAHTSHGYTLKEIADYLAIHYTTVSKVVAKEAVSKK